MSTIPPEQDPGSGEEQGAKTPIDRRMLEALVCPMTQAPLTYDKAKQELISKAAHLAYPIRGGIPIMLEEEARKLD
ncbi:Trm112 family protein [Gymnodinialimonas phycosphaerae]